MIAIVSVELSTNDACVIVALDDELLEDAIDIVRQRNKRHKGHHCYVQRNIKYVEKRCAE